MLAVLQLQVDVMMYSDWAPAELSIDCVRRFSPVPPDELDHVAVELRDLEASQTRLYEVLGVADQCSTHSGCTVYVREAE